MSKFSTYYHTMIVIMLPYLFGFLQVISFALANKYIITPTSNSSCHQVMKEPCFTLKQLAGKFPQNTTLALLPGIHYLQTELLIANITILTITAADGTDQNEGNSNVTLVFTNNARLVLKNTSSVTINGIKFVSSNSNISLNETTGSQFCQLLILESVIRGKLNALSFTGVLEIYNSNVEIIESVFGNRNIMGHYSSSYAPSTINAFNSTLALRNTRFTKTKSEWGKAINMTKCVITMVNCTIKDRHNNESTVSIKESEMLIVNSSFVNNTAWGEDSNGGALFFSDSNATIKSSVFSDNSANGSGGAIYSKFQTLRITKCVFNNNRAIKGGVIYTSSNLFTLTDSMLQGNIANRNHGGAMMINYTMNNNPIEQVEDLFPSHTCNSHSFNETYYNPFECSVENSSILLLRNSFVGNLAMEQGGAICVFNSIKSKGQLHYHVSIAIVDNNFCRNKGSEGGAILIMPFVIAIVLNSTFVENSAASIFINKTCRGGGLYQHPRSTFEIIESKFLGNNASHYGAAIHSTSSSETLLKIKNCSFTENVANKSGGAIDILSLNFGVNEISVMITESEFISNKASVDGGAIFIWSWNSTIEIFNTMFYANEAMIGGALYIDNTTVAMADTTFTHNVVIKDAYGGATYAIRSKVHAKNLTLLKNVGYHGVFYMANSVLLVSGITKIANNSGSIYAFYSNVSFGGNTEFEHNNGSSTLKNNKQSFLKGGAITGIQSNIIFTKTTIFRFNTAESGGAMNLMDRSKVFFYHNVTITQNTALVSGGGIFADQSELNVRGNCTFTSNVATVNGGAVDLSFSTITLFEGSLLFEYNRAELGGALSLSSAAKLFVFKERAECIDGSPRFCGGSRLDFHYWLILEFNNNSASYGGAIYVNDTDNYEICASGSAQSESERIECFMQVLAFYSAQNAITQELSMYINSVNIFFFENSASVAGTNLYGGLLDRCSMSHFSELYLKDRSVSSNALTHILNTTNIQLNSIASGPVQMWFCKGNQPDSNYVPSILAKKGKRFTLSVVAIDQINNMVPATIHSLVLSDSSRLRDRQAFQKVTSNCSLIHFNMFSTKDSETLYLHAKGPCSNIGMSSRKIVVVFEPCTCPIGFQQTSREDKCECQCSRSLSSHITKCMINSSSLLRQGGFWITYSNATNKTGFVIYDYCPFDYCHPSTTDTYINLNIPNGADAQCAFNRSGVLCGSCKEGLSLCFGSSQCLPCSNNWLALVIPFALAGIALVVFLIVFNLTVAVGTLNGLVLYANIVIVNRSVLFPFSESNANFIIIFISWINLDLGIETCFYNGMDAYSRTWLQLVFPTYLISLLILVIILSERSSRFAKLLSGRNPVATLVTVIVLSYTKILRMIIDALAVANINYPDSVRRVWLADGNVKYLQGKHIPLFVVALLIIIVGILYTFLRFSFQWLLQCSGKYWFLRYIANPKLQSIMDVYHAPFNPKHRYWSGLLLLVRVLLYVVSAANTRGDPNANLVAIIITITCLVFLKSWMGGKIYRHWILNLLEDAFLINIIIFAALTFYLRNTNSNQTPLAYISPVIAIAISFGILIYHLFAFVLKDTWITRKLTFVISTLNVQVMKIKSNNSNVHMNEEDSEEFETSLNLLLREDTTTTDYKLLEYPKIMKKPTSTVVEINN